MTTMKFDLVLPDLDIWPNLTWPCPNWSNDHHHGIGKLPKSTSHTLIFNSLWLLVIWPWSWPVFTIINLNRPTPSSNMPNAWCTNCKSLLLAKGFSISWCEISKFLYLTCFWPDLTTHRTGGRFYAPLPQVFADSGKRQCAAPPNLACLILHLLRTLPNTSTSGHQRSGQITLPEKSMRLTGNCCDRNKSFRS